MIYLAAALSFAIGLLTARAWTSTKRIVWGGEPLCATCMRQTGTAPLPEARTAATANTCRRCGSYRPLWIAE